MPSASHPAPSDAPRTAPAERSLIARLEGVHKAFGPLVVLKGVNLAFHAGQNTVVLGPSGAGKSVLLKHLVGLLQPDKGAVYFRETRVDSLSEARLRGVRREIGFLFQMGALFDSMTVEENIAFPLTEHTNLSVSERRDRVAQALRTVGLDGVQPKLPAQLSGGQRKRVALARALILQPALMLYDEPTTGLDPIRSDGINDLIVQLRDQMGITGVVVTHDLASARKVSDRVVVLHGGSIIADGRFDELQRSDNDYVRRFLEGRYDPREDGLTVAPTPIRNGATRTTTP